ncbi:MAG: glycosyltransferase family 2 protein [Cyclobacteriaceae bacterium]|nr:glycosyltransferase family 2 protein [Cyclobacteriaceae bacterium SS2]
MSQKKSISVTIPNYNGADLLKENLPLLYRALQKHVDDYEVIIADDASTDGSVSFLKEYYPDIILAEHKRNQGFSKNINAAIHRATKELVLFLNTDVELTDDYFEPLFKYFEKPDTFGVMGKVIGNQDGETQDAAKYPTIGPTSIRANINYLPENETSTWLPTVFLSGGWALVDRLKLTELGGFDEIYSPYYGEDVDLSLKAWKIGYQCYFEPQAICKHPISTTIGKINRSFVKIIAKRNKMILHTIHLHGIYRMVYLIILTLKVPFRLLALDLNYVKAYGQFIKMFGAISKSRRNNRNLRKAKNSHLNILSVSKKIKQQLSEIPLEKF